MGTACVNAASVQHRGTAAAALAAGCVMPDELPCQAEPVVLLPGVGDVDTGGINGRRTLIAVLNRRLPPDLAVGFAHRVDVAPVAGARHVDHPVVGGWWRGE